MPTAVNARIPDEMDTFYDCLCSGLRKGVGRELADAFGTGLVNGRKRKESGYDYVVKLVGDTCLAGLTLLMEVRQRLATSNRSPSQFKKVSFAVSSVVRRRNSLGLEMAASGFSKRLYEDGALGTDPTKNPLICELATERYDPSTIFDTPGGAKNQHGQCAEPHAYKRYFFDLEGSEQAISTVAVQARGSFEAFEITTVKRCDTCQLYSRLGDIPTDMAPSIDLYGLPMFPE